MTAPTKAVPTVALRHEEFCPVMFAEQKPRIESYPYLGDDPATGRARPTHTVTRCQDCGATYYQQIGA